MNSRTLLQNVFSFTYLPNRTYKNLTKGIKYTGFVYYPRTENFQDPPYEPSKLFLVKRIKSVKGTNPTERRALERLNIDGEEKFKNHIAVVKNIPSVNALLWKVKHLVEIRPITWKGELPKESDPSGMYLRSTGELLISPRLKLTTDQVEATEKYMSSNILGRKYLKNYLKKKWNEGFDGTI